MAVSRRSHISKHTQGVSWGSPINKNPSLKPMAFIKTKNKWEAAQAFIATWLKDEMYYCNNCDADYDPYLFPCCENPQVGRNLDHMYGLIKQNKEMQKTRINEYASTKKKQLRWGISIPPRLFFALEAYFRKTADQKLFENTKELHSFMRKFKQFTIPEKI